MGNNRGQVTIFIIIAIVLVVAAGAYFFLKDRIVQEEFPANMQPIYTKFLSCLEDEVYTGVDVLESQAGYIEVPEFEPGSRYMPFGSQLNFLGNPVPYWYYVSGNNVQKEQVPSVRDMEKQFAGFIEEKARGCGFDEFSEQGLG